MTRSQKVNGRPSWKPSDQQRANVRMLASEGIPQETIARVVGVSKSTLKRHCPEELHLGTLTANARLVAVAFDMAISGEHPEMTRFLLRCKMGWIESKD